MWSWTWNFSSTAFLWPLIWLLFGAVLSWWFWGSCPLGASDCDIVFHCIPEISWVWEYPSYPLGRVVGYCLCLWPAWSSLLPLIWLTEALSQLTVLGIPAWRVRRMAGLRIVSLVFDGLAFVMEFWWVWATGMYNHPNFYLIHCQISIHIGQEFADDLLHFFEVIMRQRLLPEIMKVFAWICTSYSRKG